MGSFRNKVGKVIWAVDPLLCLTPERLGRFGFAAILASPITNVKNFHSFNSRRTILPREEQIRVAAGLGVALLPVQAKKIPHENVAFRELNPKVMTESCIAWKGGNSSTALKAYINIVSDRGTRMR
jgi:hypothetical protein